MHTSVIESPAQAAQIDRKVVQAETASPAGAVKIPPNRRPIGRLATFVAVMLASIEAKVYFMVDLNACRTSSPKRWDAVVFDPVPPAKNSALWVAGLPGETISFVNSRMLINRIEQDLPESVFGKGYSVFGEGYIED